MNFMKNYINTLKLRWKEATKNKKFVAVLTSMFVAFLMLMAFISQFHSQIELRPGFSFSDPLLGEIPPVALNALTFISIYLTHLIAILAALLKPENFLKLLGGYFLVYFFRVFALFLLPLDPPPGTIPLIDPILILFGGGEIITKDLFYSGHTSTTFMALLMTENKKLRGFLSIGLVITVCGVLFQRVHYTIDVYAALFFAYTAYRLSTIFVQKIGLDRLTEGVQV